MYQHDIAEKKLEEKLWYVIEDTVNEVGINVNTASIYVLQHISWITKAAAKKIYNHRPYTSRTQLKKQLSPKVYELAAWFLRVPESSEIFDSTDIHPEQYPLAKFISSNLDLQKLDSEGYIVQFFTENSIKIKELYSDANINTIKFIVTSLLEAWKEKRILSTHQKARKNTAQDVKVWDIVTWVIRNVLAFGAFVDIWMKQDGLVHVSQIADTYISDPKEFVELGQTVQVKILAIDGISGKIQLSIKEATKL